MRVISVPCLQDNYAYLLVAEGGKRALVVDPSEAAPVIAAAEKNGLVIAGILNTHHHWDHTGGNEDLVRHYGELPVHGHASDAGRIPGMTCRLNHGDTLEVEGFRFEILHIPGHTLGAVAYVSEGNVFTGDTLFAAGCGRLFEGTPAQMYESLNVKLGSLPAETRVYFGHEYTESNLRFAAHVEPGNADIVKRATEAADLRKRGEPTTPSTLADEKRTNPFMRCESPEIVKSVAATLAGDPGPVAVLAAVRAAKDVFK